MNLPLIRGLSNWYRPVVLSRHSTHKCLRGLFMEFPCVFNMGVQDARRMPDGYGTVVNLPTGCRNAADKRRMKHCFSNHDIPTAPWWLDVKDVPDDAFPVVAKHRMGSRGTGVYMLSSRYALLGMQKFRTPEAFRDLFIIEKYMRYSSEYRIHATQEYAFYANRKALRVDTPEYRRWKYSYEDSVWLREDNPAFHKPNNWHEILEAATAAVRAVGLDVGACDIKVDRSPHGISKFYILEVNSAPSFGDMTAAEYMRILPSVARRVRQMRPAYDKHKELGLFSQY